MSSSRSATAAALGSTLALAATAAVWHSYRTQRKLSDSKPPQDEQEEVKSREIQIPEEPLVVKPGQQETQGQQGEDSVTDKSSVSSEDVLEKTMELTDDEQEPEQVVTEEVEEDVQEIPRSVSTSLDDVKAAGWDSEEVPALVRVVDGAVQYTGPLGAGTRCMRAIDALPKPTFRAVTTTTKPAKKARGKASKPVTTTKVVTEPFMQVNGEKGLTSYFEVNIVQGPAQGVDTTNESDLTPCVAVGISLSAFKWESAMLGWDAKSFGYHGDDGKAYFDKQKHQCGPTFGLGDTVGCGVDYEKKRVFYTVNGEFAGYSYKLLGSELKRSWIPTVSLDSHAAVQFNGAGPFKFDFTSLPKEE